MKVLFFIIAFVILPLAEAAYMGWRAYQLAIVGSVGHARRGILSKVDGAERYAKPLAIRDLLLAAGCVLFVVLVFVWPAYFAAWIQLLVAFGFAHQSFSYVVLCLVRRHSKAQQIARTEA